MTTLLDRYQELACRAQEHKDTQALLDTTTSVFDQLLRQDPDVHTLLTARTIISHLAAMQTTYQALQTGVENLLAQWTTVQDELYADFTEPDRSLFTQVDSGTDNGQVQVIAVRLVNNDPRNTDTESVRLRITREGDRFIRSSRAQLLGRFTVNPPVPVTASFIASCFIYHCKVHEQVAGIDTSDWNILGQHLTPNSRIKGLREADWLLKMKFNLHVDHTGHWA